MLKRCNNIKICLVIKAGFDNLKIIKYLYLKPTMRKTLPIVAALLFGGVEAIKKKEIPAMKKHLYSETAAADQRCTDGIALKKQRNGEAADEYKEILEKGELWTDPLYFNNDERYFFDAQHGRADNIANFRNDLEHIQWRRVMS